MPKIIKGYKNYKIYEDGSIEKLSKMAFRGGKYMSPSIRGKGYLKVSLMNGEGKKTFVIHRLVAKHFLPKQKGKKIVNHINGNKLDNRLENLEWVTHSENMLHAYKNNLVKNKRKLSEKQILDIRNSDEFMTAIAKKYGVSATAIKKIKDYKLYA